MAWIDVAVKAADDPPTPREMQEILRYVARKAKPRFYADENFPAQAVELLRRLGGRVETVQEANQTGHPDENHAAYALRNGLVLVTCDRDYLDNKRFPLIHCPAIYVFDFGRGTIQEMRAAFRCLASVFQVPQIFDKWCKVDAGTNSWTELMRYQNGATSRTRYRLGRRGLEQWVEAAG